MPYLQIDLDALKKIPDAAGAAGISPGELAWGLLRAWSYCWTAKQDHVTDTHLLGFFGGDVPRVKRALGAFQFLDPDDEGGRVKGSEKYLRISKAQSEGGKKAAHNLVPGAAHQKPEPTGEPKESLGSTPRGPQEDPKSLFGSSSALTPSTEHRTPIETTTAAAVVFVDSSAVEEKPPPSPTQETFSVGSRPQRAGMPRPEDFEPDEAGDFQPNAWGFWGWHNSERQRRDLYAESTPPHGFQEWHDAAVAKVGIDGLARAYTSFLADEDFRHRKWPINVFRSPNVWETRANPETEKRVRL